jgi:hypothetical protein
VFADGEADEAALAEPVAPSPHIER